MANAFASGTPRSTEPIFRLNNQRYMVRRDSRGVAAYTSQRISDQEIGAEQEITLRFTDLSKGSGFTWQGPEGTYDWASGWDMSTPGKATTWPRYASGAAFTTTDARGWGMYLGGYLYFGRGRYVKKYSPDATPGSTWAVLETKDLGASNVVGGRPAAFKGKGYWPLRIGAGGTATTWEEVTPGGSDSWATGPAGEEATCFRVWKEELVRGNGNVIAKCSVTPTTGGNWGAEYTVGDSGSSLTDMVIYSRLLMIGKQDGLFSFDETLNVASAIPDLAGIADDNNFLGMEVIQGYLYAPHKMGLIQYSGDTWQFVGAEAEGGLDADLSRGWGRVVSLAPAGKQVFMTVNDYRNTRGAVISLNPALGRPTQSVTPHMHQSVVDATFESCIVLSSASEPSTVKEPSTIADDSAVGTITWGSTANAASSNDNYATAAVGTSHYLKVTNFGFNLPATATVTGVTVYIERSAVE